MSNNLMGGDENAKDTFPASSAARGSLVTQFWPPREKENPPERLLGNISGGVKTRCLVLRQPPPVMRWQAPGQEMCWRWMREGAWVLRDTAELGHQPLHSLHLGFLMM